MFNPRAADRPALGVEAINPAAILSAADEHAAIRQFENGERAEFRAARRKARCKRLQRERIDDGREFACASQRLNRRYATLRRDKQRIRRRCRQRSRWRRVVHRGLHHGQFTQVDLRAVVRSGDSRWRAFLIARVVGRNRQELIGVTRASLIDAARIGRLLEPNLVVAAIFGDVHGDMAHAGTAGVVLRDPVRFVVIARWQTIDSQRRCRCRGIECLRDRRRVNRSLGIKENASGCDDRRARDRIELRRDGVTYAPFRTGGEQTFGAVLHHFASFRIDRLQQPRRNGGLRVDTHRDAQDEALRRDEVKVALEGRAARRNVNVDVADLQIA